MAEQRTATAQHPEHTTIEESKACDICRTHYWNYADFNAAYRAGHAILVDGTVEQRQPQDTPPSRLHFGVDWASGPDVCVSVERIVSPEGLTLGYRRVVAPEPAQPAAEASCDESRVKG